MSRDNQRKSDDFDDLFAKDGGDPFDDPAWEAPKTERGPKRRKEPHIGCPLAWFQRVLPLMQSAEQLAVALWLHRRQALEGQEWFSVPNVTLEEELGVSRNIKYRTLDCLEQAGVIACRNLGHQATQVKLL
jgi:hypothetical protein